MALTPEKKVKQKVTRILDRYEAYYFYPLSGGFGRSGVPDIICCYKGHFIGIECKAGSNRPTNLQERNLDAIRKNGGYALVVSEENIDDVETILRRIMLNENFANTDYT